MLQFKPVAIRYQRVMWDVLILWVRTHMRISDGDIVIKIILNKLYHLLHVTLAFYSQLAALQLIWTFRSSKNILRLSSTPVRLVWWLNEKMLCVFLIVFCKALKAIAYFSYICTYMLTPFQEGSSLCIPQKCNSSEDSTREINFDWRYKKEITRYFGSRNTWVFCNRVASI